MSEKDWQILITLHEEGTITKAARKMYMSQPALTYRIQQLEERFNCKIILRSNKGTLFTTSGEYLVQYAKKMQKELIKVQNTLENLNNNIQGILQIGVSDIFALYKLPSLLEGFVAKYPNVSIKLTTAWSTEILRLIQNEDIHIAISRGEHQWQGDKILLDQETICIASRHPIHLDELPNMNLITYKTDSQILTMFNDWWKDHYPTPPHSFMQVDGMMTCKGLVKKGLGYGFFPKICIEESDQLYTTDLTKNGIPLIRDTWLLYRKELKELNVFHAFIEYVKDYYKQ